MDFFEPFDKAQKNSDGTYGPTYEEWQAELEAERIERDALRESAVAKLAKLGLTADEINAVTSTS
jgi:hypothetical protein